MQSLQNVALAGLIALFAYAVKLRFFHSLSRFPLADPLAGVSDFWAAKEVSFHIQSGLGPECINARSLALAGLSQAHALDATKNARREGRVCSHRSQPCVDHGALACSPLFVSLTLHRLLQLSLLSISRVRASSRVPSTTACTDHLLLCQSLLTASKALRSPQTFSECGARICVRVLSGCEAILLIVQADRTRRRQLAHAFSQATVLDMESTIDIHLRKLRRWVDDCATSHDTFDIKEGAAAFVIDTLGDLAFSRPFGTLDSRSNADAPPIALHLHLAVTPAQMPWTLPIVRKIGRWLPVEWIKEGFRGRDFVRKARQAVHSGGFSVPDEMHRWPKSRLLA